MRKWSSVLYRVFSVFCPLFWQGVDKGHRGEWYWRDCSHHFRGYAPDYILGYIRVYQEGGWGERVERGRYIFLLPFLILRYLNIWFEMQPTNISVEAHSAITVFVLSNYFGFCNVFNSIYEHVRVRGAPSKWFHLSYD